MSDSPPTSGNAPELVPEHDFEVQGVENPYRDRLLAAATRMEEAVILGLVPRLCLGLAAWLRAVDERHRPITSDQGKTICCAHGLSEPHTQRWPCPDYVRARNIADAAKTDPDLDPSKFSSTDTSEPAWPRACDVGADIDAGIYAALIRADGAHQPVSRLHCDLEVGHSGPHVQLGQEACLGLSPDQPGGSWWVEWNSQQLVARPSCPARRAGADDPGCLLPAGHVGHHNVGPHWWA